jgi:hypothetical protein
MGSKRKKLNRAQAPTRTEAEEFLWHLRLPLSAEFSHQHWWGKDAKDVEIEAAIWEILRRHPFVEWFIIQTLVDWDHDPNRPTWSPQESFLQENLDPYWRNRRRKFVEFVRMWSYKNRPVGWDFDMMLETWATYSWVELPKREQKYWREEIRKIRPQHGFRSDQDYEVQVIPDLDRLPRSSLAKLRAAAKSGRNPLAGNGSLEKLWEQEHCGNAIGAFASGDLLVQFNPYVPDVEKLVSDRVRTAVQKWRRLFPKSFHRWRNHHSLGRARIPDWLGVIKSFEDAELSSDEGVKRDDQLFARYRRIIGAWDF